MIVSLKQLKMVLSKLEYSMLGYSGTDKKDLSVVIEMSKEDPGNGVMTDCVTFKATKPTSDDAEDGETTMEIEVYPESENLDPRASKTQSFKVTKAY
jgi:hypothetical protein